MNSSRLQLDPAELRKLLDELVRRLQLAACTGIFESLGAWRWP